MKKSIFIALILTIIIIGSAAIFTKAFTFSAFKNRIMHSYENASIVTEDDEDYEDDDDCNSDSSSSFSDKDEILGNGDIITKDFSVGQFDQIEAKGIGEIIIRQGEKSDIQISAESNIMSKIKLTNENGKLVISTKKGVRIKRFKHIKFTITTPTLTKLNLRGVGSLYFPDGFKSDEMNIFIKGAASLLGKNLAVDRFDLSVEGVGSAELKLLNPSVADLSIKGTGNIEAELVNAGRVEAGIFGIGNISLSGTAKEINKTKKGLGRIHDETSTPSSTNKEI